MALTLCEQEKGDPVVTELAALLHDITKPFDGEIIADQDGNRIIDSAGHWHNAIRRPPRQNEVTKLYDSLGLTGQLHSESGATLAHRLLVDRDVNEPTAAHVARTIREHLHPPPSAAIESRCLYDADTIDANIGLPAFVRNIYINLHFHDRRKEAGTPSIAETLRDSPEDFVCPYVRDNLPRWSAGKRKDFVPRLTTSYGRSIALARLDRLDSALDCFAQELAEFGSNSERGCLSVMLHYMHRRDDPSIAGETSELVANDLSSRAPRARALVHDLQQEMSGAA